MRKTKHTVQWLLLDSGQKEKQKTPLIAFLSSPSKRPLQESHGNVVKSQYTKRHFSNRKLDKNGKVEDMQGLLTKINVSKLYVVGGMCLQFCYSQDEAGGITHCILGPAWMTWKDPVSKPIKQEINIKENGEVQEEWFLNGCLQKLSKVCHHKLAQRPLKFYRRNAYKDICLGN